MPFEPGDPWPHLTVASPERVEVDLAHQTRAGRTTVYAFAPAAEVPAIAAAIAETAASFGDGFAFNIITEGEPPGEAENLGRAERFYFGAPIAERVIGRASGLALVNRQGRLRKIAPLSDLDAVLAAAQAIEAAQQQAFAPVLVLEGVFEPDLCDALVAYWDGQPKLVNAVAANRAGNASANPDFKRRADVICSDKKLATAALNRFERRILPEIAGIFRTRIVDSEAFRIGCYDSSELGGFRRHRDNGTKHTAHRAFAVSLNLNETTYEGGHVIFPEFGDRKYRPNKGGAVVFSCALLHEALPVTKGRRFGLFTFLVDERGMAIVRSRSQKAGVSGTKAE